MFLTNIPSSGDINLSNLSCFYHQREVLNITISGPLLAHQQYAIEMALRLRDNDGLTLYVSLVAL